jgi:transcriptional regulator with XRE-family HTH domain
MKKTETQRKDPVSEAVRDLRTGLGESQQAFAYRMKTAIRTIARYETVRPPKGKALAEFQKLAAETGNQKLANVFGDALRAELGPVGQLTALGLQAQVAVPRIRAEIAEVISGLKNESTHAEERIVGAIAKLEALTSIIVRQFRPHSAATKETK